jgi:hypothetical protein
MRFTDIDSIYLAQCYAVVNTVNGGEFLDQLSYFQHLNEDPDG